MSDISRNIIESSLKKKGFRNTSGKGKSDDHKWYAFCHDGKEYRQIRAKISHGSDKKTYGDSLLKKMRKGLALNSLSEAKRLLLCPMSKEEYLNLLIEKKIVPPSK